MAQETITTDAYLTFQLDKELFSVNVGKVREILEVPPITKVPHAPDYMCGVINLRGNVLPVIDARIKFGMPTGDRTLDTSVIVLDVDIEDETVMVGALVDKVQDVLEIPEEKINPSPSLGNKYRSEFIVGMGQTGEDDFIMILNIDEVFSTDEKSLLKDSFQEGQEEEG